MDEDEVNYRRCDYMEFVSKEEEENSNDLKVKKNENKKKVAKQILHTNKLMKKPASSNVRKRR